MARLRVSKYMEISHQIESRIRSGTLAEGRMPTVRDIAQAHGVSVVTAARALQVLGDRGLVRTVERSGSFVITAREARTERWALCQRVTSGPWQRVATSLFEDAFEQVAKQEGTQVSLDLFGIQDETSERDIERQIRTAVEAGVAGIFFLPSRISETGMRQDESFLKACQAAEMPVVLLERNLRGTGRPLKQDLVASDDTDGGIVCTRHLLEIGRRRIAFITGSPCSSHDSRVAGYLHATHLPHPLQSSRWSPVVLEQSTEPSGKHTYRELADRVLGLEADGVICYEDYTAMGLILELLTRRIRVPADVAVAGFDNLPIGSSFSMGVTTYALALADICRQALRLMRARVQDPGQRPVKVIVPGELIIRESTVGREATSSRRA